LQASFVAHQAILLELVHEFTDPWTGGSQHFRQGGLAQLQGGVRFQPPGYFPKQQQNPRQLPFAKMEEVIYQVSALSNDEHFRDRQVPMLQLSTLLSFKENASA
jgi:hypothetical protein